MPKVSKLSDIGIVLCKMAQRMQRTVWRGMQIDHPDRWELMRASGVGEPGCCLFADPLYQRLEVRWRVLKYVPDLDMMLQKYRQKTDEELELADLATAPHPWRGVVRDTPDGAVVHAGRFFRQSRQLVEVTIVWPQQRDLELEDAILSGIAVAKDDSERRLWQAGGMSLSIGADFELLDSSAKVGQTRWEFGAAKSRKPTLTVERIAMSEYWLEGSVGDWLQQQVPKRHRVLRREAVQYNAHPAQRLISSGKIGTLASLRGLRRVQLDLGWRCPTEARVYHISFWEASRIEQISLPGNIEIHCCRPVPLIGPKRALG